MNALRSSPVLPVAWWLQSTIRCCCAVLGLAVAAVPAAIAAPEPTSNAHANASDIVFICNTGHEYENLGAEQSLKAIAPKPRYTAFWLHLGANLAARDWHDSLGRMTPLPGADSQRYLVVSPPLLDAARAEFAGLAGLEAPYPTDRITAGELTGIVAAGYRPVVGIFGLHRFHHVADDDIRCLSAGLVEDTVAAVLALTGHVLAAG